MAGLDLDEVLATMRRAWGLDAKPLKPYSFVTGVRCSREKRPHRPFHDLERDMTAWRDIATRARAARRAIKDPTRRTAFDSVIALAQAQHFALKRAAESRPCHCGHTVRVR